ncbi:MAG: UbiX family flavin prenyltransferase [Dethiobacter sp.]|nr:MAG: UbiX family flavin prenyltransferase [Dethiobacter sp.]
MRLVVGISGATGAIYGIRVLEVLHMHGVETHLILSDAGKRTIELETDYDLKTIENLAAEVHNIKNVGASIASGSFKIDGMIIAPCSIKSLSAIANSYNENLLIRSADVTLKERRKLVLVVRETPLHLGHLQLMTMVASMGGILLPPMPAFYNLPRTIEDIIDQTVGKVLDQFGLEHTLFHRWRGADALERDKKSY